MFFKCMNLLKTIIAESRSENHSNLLKVRFASSDPSNIVEVAGLHETIDGSSDWLYVPNISASNIREAVQSAKEKLSLAGLSLSDIAWVGLWLRDMAAFAEVNRGYIESLPGVAPSRACVATALLPAERPVLLELTACRNKAEGERRVVHVQSISHWAPANIGPYSQAINVGGMIFVAGQIPLVPGSMELLEGTLDQQLRLCLRHVQRVLDACSADLRHVLQLTLFVASAQNVATSAEILRGLLPESASVMVAVAVSTLPRHADVELLAVACSNDSPLRKEITEEMFGGMKCATELCCSEAALAIACHVSILRLREEEITLDPMALETVLRGVLARGRWEGGLRGRWEGGLRGRWEAGLRVMYDPQVAGLEPALVTIATRTAASLTLVPVTRCQTSLQFLTITGLGAS